MIVHNAKYVISSPDVKHCPASTQPEYAVIGRSNVGKSSLINMLAGKKGLAKTSSMPGKTILINFFQFQTSAQANENGSKRNANSQEWFLVDLPGYGFAKRSKKEQDKLVEMIRSYILYREQLVNLFLLIDSRHEAQQIDLEFIEWLGENGVPFSIIFTKADKQGRTKTASNVRTFMKKLEEQWDELPPYFVTSSETGEGRNEVFNYIEEINQNL